MSTGSPPFTPRAKKVLELSLREALQLGDNYIGTEHLLLGLVREGEGVGAQVLVSLGVGSAQVRLKVGELLHVELPDTSGPNVRSHRTMREPAVVACSFCGRRPPESGRLVQGQGSFICEMCVREWAGRLSGGAEEQGDQPQATMYEPENDEGGQAKEGGPEQ